MKVAIFSILMVIVSARLSAFCTTRYCSSCQKALVRGLLVGNSSQGRVCRMLITRPGCCVHALEAQNGIDF